MRSRSSERIIKTHFGSKAEGIVVIGLFIHERCFLPQISMRFLSVFDFLSSLFTMNSLLNTVIAINNGGVHMMSGGDYASASSAFGTALNQVKSFLESAEYRPPLTPESQWPCIHSSVQVPFADQTTSFPIFTECIALSPILSEGSSSSIQDADLIVAVILYNAGLAFHLRAQSASSTKGLRRASHLYKLAMHLCQNSSPCIITEHTSLLLGLSNNLAALAMESYNYEAFETQRRLMSEILMETDAPQDFFCSNYVATMDVLAYPAPAA